MSFLAPLYIAGIAAVSLPIIFHLIRRIPRGRLPYSSLMFLKPSPPRITRRSRLDNLLLLLLRAAALCLLAFAFGRPFLREAAHLEMLGSRARQVAIVLDTSASMRRGDLWFQAVEKAREVLDELSPLDRVALFHFDDRLHTVVDFDDEAGVPPVRARELVRERLATLGPTWGASDLGAALVAVADALDVVDDARRSDAALQIVLVTDLQQGSRLAALEGYQWPSRVQLEVRRVTPPGTTNAGVHLLARSGGGEAKEGDRVRVTNDADSGSEQFSLRWASASGIETAREVVQLYVPPGESRVARVPRPAGESRVDRLILEGDDHDFDNTFHITPVRQEDVTLEYVGVDAREDAGGLRYYLERALSDTARWKIDVVTRAPDDSLSFHPSRPVGLVVVTEPVGEDAATALAGYLENGGTVLRVLRDPGSDPSLARLLGREAFSVEEARVNDYVMLSEIDFSHPLFAPFADPRFSDFTKIHFWKHRRIDLPELEGDSDLRVLARFDSGDAALIEKTQGEGRLLVLASGWHPPDSQLALSSKFVPLIVRLLEGKVDLEPRLPFYHVHDRVPLDAGFSVAAERSIRKPDGTIVKLTSDARTFGGTDQPGVYELRADGALRRFAVNLSPEESRVVPLEVEELEQRGVRLGMGADEVDRERQMRDRELESSQKLWRWLLASALGLLLVETLLAGWLSRARIRAEVTE